MALDATLGIALEVVLKAILDLALEVTLEVALDNVRETVLDDIGAVVVHVVPDVILDAVLNVVLDLCTAYYNYFIAIPFPFLIVLTNDAPVKLLHFIVFGRMNVPVILSNEPPQTVAAEWLAQVGQVD